MARKPFRAAGVCLICLFLFASPQASLAEPNRGWKKRWIASVVVLAAAQALEIRRAHV